jgi:hypothetical protein
VDRGGAEPFPFWGFYDFAGVGTPPMNILFHDLRCALLCCAKCTGQRQNCGVGSDLTWQALRTFEDINVCNGTELRRHDKWQRDGVLRDTKARMVEDPACRETERQGLRWLVALQRPAAERGASFYT